MIALIIGVLAALTPGDHDQPAEPPLVAMAQLTVPADRLPAGCALSPADSERLDNGRTRLGLWAGLRITSNPWSGTEPAVEAAIHERIAGPHQVPDGPPPTARELSRYRLQYAEGVEEAYAAIYRTAQEMPELITVYAARYVEGAAPVARSRRAAASNPLLVRLTIGRTVIVASGNGGACMLAVAAHLRSLSQ